MASYVTYCNRQPLAVDRWFGATFTASREHKGNWNFFQLVLSLILCCVYDEINATLELRPIQHGVLASPATLYILNSGSEIDYNYLCKSPVYYRVTVIMCFRFYNFC